VVSRRHSPLGVRPYFVNRSCPEHYDPFTIVVALPLSRDGPTFFSRQCAYTLFDRPDHRTEIRRARISDTTSGKRCRRGTQKSFRPSGWRPFGPSNDPGARSLVVLPPPFQRVYALWIPANVSPSAKYRPTDVRPSTGGKRSHVCRARLTPVDKYSLTVRFFRRYRRVDNWPSSPRNNRIPTALPPPPRPVPCPGDAQDDDDLLMKTAIVRLVYYTIIFIIIMIIVIIIIIIIIITIITYVKSPWLHKYLILYNACEYCYL